MDHLCDKIKIPQYLYLAALQRNRFYFLLNCWQSFIIMKVKTYVQACTCVNRFTLHVDTWKLFTKTNSWQQSLRHLANIQQHISMRSLPFGSHTRLLHMLHISRWITRLQEFTPVERMVIMHVAKCFSSSWTLYHLHATHLLSLREQIALSETIRSGSHTCRHTYTHTQIQSETR